MVSQQQATMSEQHFNLDPRLYVSPETLDQERRRIFWKSWQFIGPASEVATPGDYIAADISGLGVIALRGKDGLLRGFKNVCRHRGARLLDPGAGKCRLIVCPYHKWSFSDTGRLVQAPWFGKDPAIIPEDWPLEEVSVDIWRGLVFASIAPEESLIEQLGDLVDELADEPMESYQATDRAKVDFDANWKIYTDNFVEGYHIPGTHPSFYAAINFEEFETTAHKGYVRMTAPPKEGLFYRGKWLWMWPNWTLSLFQGGMNTSRINPLSVDRTEQLYNFYFADTSDATVADRKRTIDGNLAVVREDYEVCVTTHRNYAAGTYSPGPLSSRHEKGVHYFQERVRTGLGL
ncbi:MAG: aromatic ring-hydroxylating dioxygenase subunit alpha [Rhodobacteraceae bacterium]|nr:aromatic ring-hydroxylating dioxygenase subunit alpha [Paracoccaceae bacterium]